MLPAEPSTSSDSPPSESVIFPIVSESLSFRAVKSSSIRGRVISGFEAKSLKMSDICPSESIITSPQSFILSVTSRIESIASLISSEASDALSAAFFIWSTDFVIESIASFIYPAARAQSSSPLDKPLRLSLFIASGRRSNPLPSLSSPSLNKSLLFLMDEIDSLIVSLIFLNSSAMLESGFLTLPKKSVTAFLILASDSSVRVSALLILLIPIAIL